MDGWADENTDVLAKLMDYMPSEFNTIKANITVYIWQLLVWLMSMYCFHNESPNKLMTILL